MLPLIICTETVFHLLYQTDYHVNANEIFISPSQVPQVGDNLYFSYIAAPTSTRSIAQTRAPDAYRTKSG